jgi:hypothetical protein
VNPGSRRLSLPDLAAQHKPGEKTVTAICACLMLMRRLPRWREVENVSQHT